jgi:hypothetical protein
VDVRNEGTLAILACGVRFTLILPDGTTTPGGFMVDAAHIPPAERQWQLAPGGHAAIPTGEGLLVSSQATGGSARATFVIFEDDTALGDERAIILIMRTSGRRRR